MLDDIREIHVLLPGVETVSLFILCDYKEIMSKLALPSLNPVQEQKTGTQQKK